MLPSLAGRGTVPTAPGSQQPQLPGRAATHSESSEKGEENALCLLPPSVVTPCPTAGGALSPGGARGSQTGQSPLSARSVAPESSGITWLLFCPQAHPPCPGWPSLAGLSGFGALTLAQILFQAVPDV